MEIVDCIEKLKSELSMLIMKPRKFLETIYIVDIQERLVVT